MPIPIDQLVRTRRRTIALIVQPDGTLTVRAPLQLSEARIRRFVDSHADWVARHQELARRSPPAARKQFLAGETFLLLGSRYPLQILPRQRPALTFDGQTFRLAESARGRAEQVFVQWYRAQAGEVLTRRVSTLAAAHGFSWKKVRISSARTRWGSCSPNGTLSFPWRLVLAPLPVVDYVVIHELVHTQIRNHSRAFWLEVARLLPGYKAHVRWLKQNGRQLTL